MPGRARHGVDAKHRAAHHVEGHLQVEAIVEEPDLLDAAKVEIDDRVPVPDLRLGVHGEGREEQGETGPAGNGVERGPVEELPLEPGDNLEAPHKHGDDEDEEAVEAVPAGLAGPLVDGVSGNPAAREDEGRDGERDEDRQRREEPGDLLSRGQFEEMLDAKPLNHRGLPPVHSTQGKEPGHGAQ